MSTEIDDAVTMKAVTKDSEVPVPSSKAGCKIVVRLLPSSMNESEFLEAVSPLPPHDYFYFVSAEKSLEPHSFSRAYINIIKLEDVVNFKESFDGYVFVDSQGNEFPAMVEFAPYQKIPKVAKAGKRKDPKMGTIESDPDYVKFKEAIENPEKDVMQPEQQLEEIEARERIAAKAKGESQSTPLLDFIREKKAEKMRIREEKREARRRKEEERKRNREEERARRQKQQRTAASSGSATEQDLSSSKHRKEPKEFCSFDTGDAVVATRVFKSTSSSKKRPEKRERRSDKEEPTSGSADSGKSREKKEQIRLQKRSEINDRRQKERKEKYEKKKLDARQEKKLRTTAAKAHPSEDNLADEESATAARPKRYSDRRREDKIKRENKTAPVADVNFDYPTKTEEKLSEQISNMNVVDKKMKGRSRAREEGMSSHEANVIKTGRGGSKEAVKKTKEEHESFEGGEEKELTEEEKRRKEEIRARRDKERQERKERMKNKTRPEAQIYRPGQFSSQKKKDKDKVGVEQPQQTARKTEEMEETMASPSADLGSRRGGRGGRGGGRGGYLQSKGKGRKGGGDGAAANDTKDTPASDT